MTETPRTEYEPQLCDLVVAAIRQSFGELPQAVSDSEIAGLALCTDDNLCTLYATIITVDELVQSDDRDLLHVPTDWPMELGDVHFEGPNSCLRDSKIESMTDHVDISYRTLVRALQHLRDVGFFHGSVVLSVLSTDPSEYLEQLWSQSFDTLNDRAAVDVKNTFLSKWA